MKIKLKIIYLIICSGINAFSATYTVTNTNDSGAGSLRQAIIDANGNTGHDIINFDLGSSIPYTISLSSALPSLTDNAGVTIDGWENGANDGTPNSVAVFSTTSSTPLNPSFVVIISNGGAIAVGLTIASNNNIIKGLVLQNFGDGTPSSNDIAITISGNSNQILGCYIGLDYTGTTKAANTHIGINITGNNNTIGDGTAAGANLIGGMNQWVAMLLNGSGIRVTGAGATGNTIIGNLIGLQKDGQTIIASNNTLYGIEVTTSANGNIIGGTASGQGNVISGNSAYGIGLRNDSYNTTILGNRIGTRANGINVVTANTQGHGIDIVLSKDNTIGNGAASGRNIISANNVTGIYITATISAADSTRSVNNVIKGNFVGLGADSSAITGSVQMNGIEANVNVRHSIYGGNTINESNIISGNSTYGLRIRGSTNKYVKIAYNLIYNNNNQIPFSYGGCPGCGNQGKPKPTFISWGTTFIEGTAEANDTVEIYYNTTNTATDVEYFLDKVVADGTGYWSWTASRNSRNPALGGRVLAIARDAKNNSSEFGFPPSMTTLPIELIRFDGKCYDNVVHLNWSTASETNNDYFTIERSLNAIDILDEFIVKGSGNSSEVKNYTFQDKNPLDGVAYYRLKQTDYDGKQEYFNFIAVDCANNEFSDITVYPNPVTEGGVLNFSLTTNASNEIFIALIDAWGREVYSKVLISEYNGQNIFGIDLENKLEKGIYFIRATTDSSIFQKRIVVN